MNKTRLLLAVGFILSLLSLSLPVLALDAFDDFSVSPSKSGKWALSSGWTWLGGARALSASAGAVCSASWKKTNTYRDGLLEARVKLNPTASLLFSWQSAPSLDRYRYLALTAGAPGTVTLGQKGTIGATGEKVFASKKMRLLANRWYTVRIYIRPLKGVDVYLGPVGQQPAWVFSSGTVKLAAGKVGLMSSYAGSQFDNFAFLDPVGKGCGKCHAGNPPAGYELAADTMKYWNGSWWDNESGLEQPTDTLHQQGGHGDPDHYRALGCVGVNGCHDLNQSAASHLDGKAHKFADRTAADSALPTANTYHLRREFIKPSPVLAWEIQVAFDDFCYLACHRTKTYLEDFRHPRRDNAWEHPGSPGEKIVEMGTHSTAGVAPYPLPPYPMDSDLSLWAWNKTPYFAPCISCHDPHGTGITDVKPVGPTNPYARNFMLRNTYNGSTSNLCGPCHI